MLRELQAKDYVTDSGALLTFLQAAIQAVNVSSNLGDASADTNLLLKVLSKTDRTSIQFVDDARRGTLLGSEPTHCC